MTGLYVHIPFCRRKCGYCDFSSAAGMDALIGPYIEALGAEAARSAPLFAAPDTLYIGGGTPSLPSPEQLDSLFRTLSDRFGPVKKFFESTFEANPESLTPEKAAVLKAAGITRVSLGLQASQDRLLARLGRLASFRDFLQAFRALRLAGFDNLNLDLMTGLPGQSREDFLETLRAAIALGPEHISFYALEVHPGTPFAAEGVREDPEAAAGMFHDALPELEKAGYLHYEISNFAKPGRECAHNLNYWDQGDYLGLGTAAASHKDGRRWSNTGDVARYMTTAASASGPDLECSETLSPQERSAERIMLGLRKTAGIELPEDIFVEFRERIAGLSARGLLEVSGRRLRIKREALYVSNAVFREFV
ncbi:MAG TPA: radical SAM family heme chaperone HemW [Elusimicrobiales bacterium]|nr:radical SAM family heme chaperone HemW [Elusimicrobiales bacterium]